MPQAAELPPLIPAQSAEPAGPADDRTEGTALTGRHGSNSRGSFASSLPVSRRHCPLRSRCKLFIGEGNDFFRRTKRLIIIFFRQESPRGTVF